MVERLIERSSCWCGELYSLQCGRRSRAWRRSVCEAGVGELCVVVGRRRCGSRRCGWRLLVAISANCCDTWWSISASKLGVLCRRSILSHCACRQLASRQHRSKTTGERNCTSFGQRLFTHLFYVIIVSFTTETSHSVKVSFSTVLFSRGNVDRCCFEFLSSATFHSVTHWVELHVFIYRYISEFILPTQIWEFWNNVRTCDAFYVSCIFVIRMWAVLQFSLRPWKLKWHSELGYSWLLCILFNTSYRIAWFLAVHWFLSSLCF